MNEAKEEIKKTMEVEKIEMQKQLNIHFESKMATAKRMLSDIDVKVQSKMNEAKAKVAAFNHACDQKKTELETKRKEIDTIKVPTTPKRYAVRNPYKTPPSKARNVEETTCICGGGEETLTPNQTPVNIENTPTIT